MHITIFNVHFKHIYIKVFRYLISTYYYDRRYQSFNFEFYTQYYCIIVLQYYYIVYFIDGILLNNNNPVHKHLMYNIIFNFDYFLSLFIKFLHMFNWCMVHIVYVN